MAAPIPSPAPFGRPFPCARLVTAWCQQSPYGRPGPSWPPFPRCQPVFRLVSRPCLFPSIPLPNSRPFPLCQPVFRLVSAITPR